MGEAEERVGRDAVLIAACLLVAALVSIARALADGTIDLVGYESSFSEHFIVSLILGVPLACAAALYARALRVTAGVEAIDALFRRALLIQLCALIALPLTSSDVFVNLAYGALARAGLNPHAHPPAALGEGHPFLAVVSAWRDNPSPYGPLMTPFAAVAGLADSVVAALAVFKLEMIALAVAILALGRAYCRRYVAADRAGTAFAILALSPLFAWEISGEAHNDAVLVLCLFAYVFLVRTGRDRAAFFAILAACAAKYVAAPVLAIHLAYVWRRSRRDAAAMAVLAAAVGFFCVRPYYSEGPSVPESLYNTTGVAHHTRSFIDLAWFLLTPFGAAAQRTAYWIGWGAAIAAMAAFTARGMWRAIGVRAVHRESLIVLLACCLATPWGQPWYATWLLPFAVADEDPSWRRLVVVYGALSIAQYGLLIDPISYIVVSGLPAFLLWRLLRSEAPLGEHTLECYSLGARDVGAR